MLSLKIVNETQTFLKRLFVYRFFVVVFITKRSFFKKMKTITSLGFDVSWTHNLILSRWNGYWYYQHGLPDPPLYDNVGAEHILSCFGPRQEHRVRGRTHNLLKVGHYKLLVGRKSKSGWEVGCTVHSCYDTHWS